MQIGKKKEKVYQKTELVVTKEEFEGVLNERIKIGQDLYDRKIIDKVQLSISRDDLDSWDDWNLEYLKISFNNEENEYRDSYKYSDGGALSFVVIGGDYDFDKEVYDHKCNMKNKLDDLKKLLNKIPLLKTQISLRNNKDIKPNEL